MPHRRLLGAIMLTLGLAGVTAMAYVLYGFYALYTIAFLRDGLVWSSLYLSIAMLIASAILAITGYRLLRPRA